MCAFLNSVAWLGRVASRSRDGLALDEGCLAWIVRFGADHCTEHLATTMRIWSASAIDRYYRDPTIELVQTKNRDHGKSPAAGYYIVPHRGPDCHQPFGGVFTVDLGPFPTRAKARKWSRTYLSDPGAR